MYAKIWRLKGWKNHYLNVEQLTCNFVNICRGGPHTKYFSYSLTLQKFEVYAWWYYLNLLFWNTYVIVLFFTTPMNKYPGLCQITTGIHTIKYLQMKNTNFQKYGKFGHVSLNLLNLKFQKSETNVNFSYFLFPLILCNDCDCTYKCPPPIQYYFFVHIFAMIGYCTQCAFWMVNW